jgi:hypothetical protein
MKLIFIFCIIFIFIFGEEEKSKSKINYYKVKINETSIFVRENMPMIIEDFDNEIYEKCLTKTER